MKEKILAFFKTNKITWIVIAIVIILIFLTIIIASNRSKIGNTSTNLNNLGFSVEKDGWVYYLGIKDDNADGIYKIKANGKKSQKVSDDYGIYLNKSGSYIYYLNVENYDIERIKTNGKDKETIIKGVDRKKVSVVDNWIYYFKDSKFYREKINGDGKQILSNRSISNYEVNGKWIYYSYTSDGKETIAKMKTNGEQDTIIDKDLSDIFFIKNNKIYYVYESYDDNNIEYSYQLFEIKTNGKDKKKLADLGENIQLDSINFNEEKLFYVKSNDEDEKPSIYSMKINGKDENELIELDGYYTMININDGWIYYTDQNENAGSQIYRVKLNGKNKQDLSL